MREKPDKVIKILLTSGLIKNLLTHYKLRRKTDPKLKPWDYFFIAFLLEPLVGDQLRSCLLL